MRRHDPGLSVLEAILTLLLLVFLTLGFLKVFSQKTAVPFSGSAGGASLSIEAALSSLARDVRNASAGPLPLPVLPVANDVSEGFTLPRPGGGGVRVRKGTDVVALRGVLRHPLLVLDSLEGPPIGSRAVKLDAPLLEPGTLKLRIPRYPARLNPPRQWISRPGGAGMKWDSEAAASNPSFDSTIAALQKHSSEREVTFVVASQTGAVLAARVTGVDASQVERGCDCRAPLPFPGECPPGRRGCFLEVTLDFGPEALRRLDGGSEEAASSPPRDLASGGILDEVLYFVAAEEGSEASYLASAVRTGKGYEISRVADDIEDLQIAYGLADEITGAFDPMVSEVSSPRAGRPEKRGDQWWPNRPAEPMPAPAELVLPEGGNRLRMLRVSVRAKGAGSVPAELLVPVQSGERP